MEETDHEVTLFTRPRQFGKTLMISMMENFFNIRKDNKEHFEGLKITEYKKICEKYQNQYPVLLISLKDTKTACIFQGKQKYFHCETTSPAQVTVNTATNDMRKNNTHGSSTMPPLFFYKSSHKQ